MSTTLTAEEVDSEDVSFSPKAIAAAWEAVEDVPVCVAVAITNNFSPYFVTASDGEMCDGDVTFKDGNVLFEEKAVGVCDRETAEKYATHVIELDRADEKVLAIDWWQIFYQE